MINGYIYSFFTRADEKKRSARRAVHHRQVNWFVEHTALHLFILAMNYDEEDFQREHEAAGRVTYLITEPMKANQARFIGFNHFYASDADWAVMLDNDSTLYSGPQHNSGAKFFAEMDAQIGAYRDVDFFYPLNPAVMGFSATYAKDPELYRDNHVFDRGVSMKGSMFFVRNFRKAGQTECWPDPTYEFMDDNKLAIDAIAKGKKVYQCKNIILKEEGLSSSSFSTDPKVRIANMIEPCKRLEAEYGHLGLCVKPSAAHNLEYRNFYKSCWHSPKRVIIAKDEAKRREEQPLFAWGATLPVEAPQKPAGAHPA